MIDNNDSDNGWGFYVEIDIPHGYNYNYKHKTLDNYTNGKCKSKRYTKIIGLHPIQEVSSDLDLDLELGNCNEKEKENKNDNKNTNNILTPFCIILLLMTIQLILY